MNFSERVRQANRARGLLCVGLDPHAHLLREDSAEAALEFCLDLIDKTAEVACAYKPNAAFFEQYGAEGHRVLEQVLDAVPGNVLTVLDAKRGDIASTADAYARATLDVLDADCVTLNPYMGWDTLEPFLDRPGKGAFVLCRTSNPGARDYQDLEVDGEPLYMRVARDASKRAVETGAVGLVVGATYPDELVAIRQAVGVDVPFLIPGVGAQGAKPEETARLAGGAALVNVGRAIAGADDPAEAARRYARALQSG